MTYCKLMLFLLTAENQQLRSNGDLLDNNDTERLIRDMVMGKKAYIYGVEWILTVQLICGYAIR